MHESTLRSKGDEKVKVKVHPVQATKALRAGRGITLLNLRPRHWIWGWVVSTTPRPLYPRRKTRYRKLGGPQDRSGRVRKISPPTGIRSRDRPARSESLYRLSHRGSTKGMKQFDNWVTHVRSRWGNLGYYRPRHNRTNRIATECEADNERKKNNNKMCVGLGWGEYLRMELQRTRCFRSRVIKLFSLHNSKSNLKISMYQQNCIVLQ